MRKAIALSVLAIFVGASAATAADIHLRVTTDKYSYLVGETVNWTFYVWADNSDVAPEVAGVSLIAVDLLESENETLTPALTSNLGAIKWLTDSTYDAIYGGFTLQSAGLGDIDGLLANINVYQLHESRVLGIGNTGDPDTVFAKGSFEAYEVGTHTLSPENRACDYWPGSTGNAVRFALGTTQDAEFTVDPIPEPATVCIMGIGLSGLLTVIRRRRRRT